MRSDGSAVADLGNTPPRSSAGWTLLVVALATFMLMLDLTVVNVALPDIRGAFESSFADLQWMLDAYALGLATVLLAAGSLADRIGRRRVFTGGLIVFTVASLACGLAPGNEFLIYARFVQGLGGAILFAVGPALLGHEFRGRSRGRAFGVFGAVAGLAIAFGPLIGGLLVETLGWRWIFLINVPPAVAALAIGLRKMRESTDMRSSPPDWLGSVTFSAALFLLVLGFMRGEPDGWVDIRVVGSFVAAASFLAVFVVIQRRKGEEAMFDLTLFRNRTFVGLSIATTMSAMSVMPALFLLISYVRNVLEFPALASGVRFLPLTLLVFVAAAVSGLLVAKWRPALLVGTSQLFIAAGLAAALLVQDDSTWTALIPSMVLIGIGMGLFNPPRAALSIGVTTTDKGGMASGINETFQQAGLAVGIAAFGALFQSRVAVAFAAQPVSALLGERSDDAAVAVAAGGVSEVVDAVPSAISESVGLAGRAAFITGLHEVMVCAGVLAAVGAVVAFTTLRVRDLDADARSSGDGPRRESVSEIE